MEDGIEQPFDKDLGIEALAFHADFVKFIFGHKHFFVVLEVKQCEVNYRQGSHCDVVHLVDEWFVKSLSREGRVETEGTADDQHEHGWH